MSNNTINEMNKSLYAASYHLLEASKYLMNVEDWRPAAMELIHRAKLLADTIQAEPEKITVEKANSILDEILGNDLIETKETK